MIEADNLTKEFAVHERDSGFLGAVKSLFKRNSKKITAVDNISFNIDQGEIVGYIGANGAGKSTTIKMLTGILVPTEGECKVNGLIPYENRKENAKDIGVVFGQRTQLWWDLPLNETFSILKDIYDVSDKNYQERMEFLNQVLALEEFISQPVRTLSLGQRMRADLAAALIHNPQVIFLDEPTVGLDIVVKEKIRNAIKEINQSYDTTIILTTHDIDDIEELCDRIIIIDEGQKIYDGTLERILNSYGYMRTIEADLKFSENVDKLSSSDFNLPKDSEAFQITTEENTVFVEFNSNRLDISEVTSYLMEKLEVKDINIYEAEIEEIVKQIYKNGGI